NGRVSNSGSFRRGRSRSASIYARRTLRRTPSKGAPRLSCHAPTKLVRHPSPDRGGIDHNWAPTAIHSPSEGTLRAVANAPGLTNAQYPGALTTPHPLPLPSTPLDFLARLASLVPSPRVNLTRFHGVFAPNACLRSKIVPALRGRGKHARAAGE